MAEARDDVSYREAVLRWLRTRPLPLDLARDIAALPEDEQVRMVEAFRRFLAEEAGPPDELALERDVVALLGAAGTPDALDQLARLRAEEPRAFYLATLRAIRDAHAPGRPDVA